VDASTPPTAAGSLLDHEEHPSICVGCGLCCDGTVLSHIAVSDDTDLGLPLAALGVTVIVEADPPVFALPCPAVHDGVCAIYDRHRPRACSWFECDLSRAVAAGELGVDEARRVIGETKALRDRVRAGDADPSELQAAVARHFRQD